MCKYIKNSNNKDFIIGAQVGIIYRLKKENPYKNFYLVTNLLECPNMKKSTIEKVFDVLKNTKNIGSVSDEIRKKAYLSIYKMLNVSC
jgi:quinolinate synthase